MYSVCEKILVENNGGRRCKNLGKKEFWKVEYVKLFLEKYNSIFGWISRLHFFECFIFKRNAQFFKKLTFDGFQTKPLWKLEILQKLLLLKVITSPKL